MANGGCDVRPEPPLIVLSEASTGDADGLAGEAGTEEIHAAQQVGQGQPGDIVQDGCRLETSIGKPRFEDAARVRRHFTVGDRTDGVPKFGKQHLHRQAEHPDAGAQVEKVHVHLTKTLPQNVGTGN